MFFVKEILKFVLIMVGGSAVLGLIGIAYNNLGLGWTIAIVVAIALLVGIYFLSRSAKNVEKEVKLRAIYRVSCPHCLSQDLSLDFNHNTARCSQCGKTMHLPDSR